MVKAKVKNVPVKIKNGLGIKIPYWDIDTGKKGPCFLITAALHGNEVHGSEVMRRFCPIAEKKIIRGRMVLLPFANPLALHNRRPHIISTLAHPKGKEIWDAEKKVLRFDLKDNINCTWPGDPDGNEAQQITHVLFNKIVKHVTHCVDMHCWSRFTVTAALSSDDEKVLEFARMSALPAIYINRKEQGIKGIPKLPCTLDMLLSGMGRLAFAMEFSGQYVLVEKEVQRGVRMLSNCSKYLGMFNGRPEGMEETVIFKDGKSKEFTVTAPVEGLFMENGLSTGDFVKKGSLLGTLFNDRTLKTIKVKAPASGYLYTYGHYRRFCDVDLADMHPYADKGDILATIVK